MKLKIGLMIIKIYRSIYWRIERKMHSYLLKRKLVSEKLDNLKLHFGSGSDFYPNYIQVDYQLSRGVDIQEDLNRIKSFRADSAIEIFSNAFFEHLYKDDRKAHLKKGYEILKKNGLICYLGIPYFPGIASLYIEGKIDLYSVYRWTHGAPETDGVNGDKRWLSQLHKSLFDYNELKLLLENAGFTNYLIFKYCYPTENIKVNCGFFAIKNYNSTNLQEECIKYITTFHQDKVLVNTMEFMK